MWGYMDVWIFARQVPSTIVHKLTHTRAHIYPEKENLIQTIFRNYDSDANEQLNKEVCESVFRTCVHCQASRA